jgi:hypothetical protein
MLKFLWEFLLKIRRDCFSEIHMYKARLGEFHVLCNLVYHYRVVVLSTHTRIYPYSTHIYIRQKPFVKLNE